jgi:DNA-binding GntR family transcriptional regulator
MIHATLIDHVAETLREEILSGAIEPGTRLRQDDIAQKLGVSHIPVREAFRQLGSEGLVRIEPRRGAVVTPLSVDELLELVQVRQVLEPHLLSLAIPKLTAADIDFAQKSLLLVRKNKAIRSYPKRNWDFHAALYRPANAPVTYEIVQRLHGICERYLRLESDFDEVDRQHQLLLDYAKSGKTEKAAKLLRSHIGELAERTPRAMAKWTRARSPISKGTPSAN